jgi:hypothetical protein
MYLILVSLALGGVMTAQSIQAARLRGAQDQPGHVTPWSVQGLRGVMYVSPVRPLAHDVTHDKGLDVRGLGVIPNSHATDSLPERGTSSRNSMHVPENFGRTSSKPVHKIMELWELLARLAASVPAPRLSARAGSMLLSPIQHTTPASPASVPPIVLASVLASASASAPATTPNVFPYTTGPLRNTHNATQNYVSVQQSAHPGDRYALYALSIPMFACSSDRPCLCLCVCLCLCLCVCLCLCLCVSVCTCLSSGYTPYTNVVSPIPLFPYAALAALAALASAPNAPAASVPAVALLAP